MLSCCLTANIGDFRINKFLVAQHHLCEKLVCDRIDFAGKLRIFLIALIFDTLNILVELVR